MIHNEKKHKRVLEIMSNIQQFISNLNDPFGKNINIQKKCFALIKNCSEFLEKNIISEYLPINELEILERNLLETISSSKNIG